MTWTLYEYLDARGRNLVRPYLETFDRRTQGKITQKLDMLKDHGTELPPNLLSGTSNGNIKKLKVRGNVQVRIMVCSGPINLDDEFTLLFATQERDGVLVHIDAVEQAVQRRTEIINDANRRSIYERIT